MFCTKCGSRNYDDAKFCTTCSAPLGVDAPTPPPYTPSTPGPAPKPGKSNAGLTIGIIVAVVAVVIGVAIWVITSLTGINGTINKIEKGLKKCDIEMLWEACMPKDSLDEMIKEEFDGDKDEYREEINDMEYEMKEVLDDEEIKVVSVKRTGKIKDFKKSEIEEFGFDRKRDMLEAIEEEFDIDNVKDVKKCKVKLTYKIDGDKETVSGDAYFYKAGGKWYFLTQGSPIISEISEEFGDIF